jgi:hypothetical protein
MTSSTAPTHRSPITRRDHHPATKPPALHCVLKGRDAGRASPGSRRDSSSHPPSVGRVRSPVAPSARLRRSPRSARNRLDRSLIQVRPLPAQDANPTPCPATRGRCPDRRSSDAQSPRPALGGCGAGRVGAIRGRGGLVSEASRSFDDHAELRPCASPVRSSRWCSLCGLSCSLVRGEDVDGLPGTLGWPASGGRWPGGGWRGLDG